MHLQGTQPAISGPAANGLTSFMIAHPVLVATSLAKSLNGWIVDGLVGFVGGNRVYLTSALFTLTLLGGVVTSLARPDRKVVLLLTYVGGHFLVMCLFLITLPRYLLPILPLCMLIAVRFMTEGSAGEGCGTRGTSALHRILAVVVFLVLLPVGAYQALSDMLARHPYRELAVAEQMEMSAGKNIVVAGTFPFMQRYVGYRWRHLDSDFGSDGDQATKDYFYKLKAELKEAGADYIITGPASLGQRPVELLMGQNIPDFLQLGLLEPDVVVYRVLKDRL